MLDFKNQILDKEKDTLGRIRRQKNEIDEKIRRYQLQLEQSSDEMIEQQKRGLKAGDLLVYSFQAENTRKYLEQLKKEQEALAAEVERQTDVVRKASQDVSQLGKAEGTAMGTILLRGQQSPPGRNSGIRQRSFSTQ